MEELLKSTFQSAIQSDTQWALSMFLVQFGLFEELPPRLDIWVVGLGRLETMNGAWPFDILSFCSTREELHFHTLGPVQLEFG